MEPRTPNGERTVSSISGTEKIGSSCRTIKLDHYHKTVKNINSKSIINLGHDTITLQEENRVEVLQHWSW